MIKDVKTALAEHGLNLNLDKCAVQTSNADAPIQPIEIDGQRIPMVSASSRFKVLGTQYTLQERCTAEIKGRIAAAWSKFYALRPVLGKRDGNLDKRLRFFDTCVSQQALWCCESWPITMKEKDLLRTTQNCLLRRLAGPRRKIDETWVEWIKRSTRKSIAAAKHVGIRPWVDVHLKSKWSWAGHVVRMDDNRLARRAVKWHDSMWWALEVAEFTGLLRCRRPHQTRWFRWGRRAKTIRSTMRMAILAKHCRKSRDLVPTARCQVRGEVKEGYWAHRARCIQPLVIRPSLILDFNSVSIFIHESISRRFAFSMVLCDWPMISYELTLNLYDVKCLLNDFQRLSMTFNGVLWLPILSNCFYQKEIRCVTTSSETPEHRCMLQQFPLIFK